MSTGRHFSRRRGRWPWFPLVVLCATAPLGAQYQLEPFTIDGGGGSGDVGSYSIIGSIGQPDAGPSVSAANYTLAGGFLPYSGVDGDGPIPGSFAIGPASPVTPATLLTASFAGWSDASLPLSYEIREDTTVIVSAAADPSPSFNLAEGEHLISGRVYDAAGQFSETAPLLVLVDGSPPAGGSFTVTPSPPLIPATLLTAHFADWTDAAPPLSYEVLEGATVVVPQGGDPDPSFNLPAGTHDLSGRIYDSLGHFVEVGPVSLTVDPVVVWVGSSGFWDEAAKWDPGLPGPTDHAFIDVPGLQLVDVRAVGGLTYTVGRITMTGDDILGVANGTLFVSNDSLLSGFNQAGGLLGGAGNLTVNGGATIKGGTQSGSGSLILHGDGTILNLGVNLDGGRTLRVAPGGLEEWTAGTINLDSTAAAGGGTLWNEGVFRAIGDAANTIQDSSGSGLIVNDGTFLKDADTSSDVTTISTPFNNNGTVLVAQGILSLTDGGVHSGTFQAEAEGTVRFGGGIQTLDGDVTGTGAGTLGVTSGTVTSAGGFDMGTCALSGGSLIANSAHRFVHLGMSPGATLSGTGVVNATGTADLIGSSSSSLPLTMSGSGTTRVEGTGTIFCGIGGLTLSGGRILHVATNSTTTWTGGTITVSGGLGTVQNDGVFVASGATGNLTNGHVVNNGTFLKTASAANHTTTFTGAFDNHGSVEVETGTVNLGGGGTHDGAFSVSSNAVLRFGGGTHTLAAGSSIAAPDGGLSITGGTVDSGASPVVARDCGLSGGTFVAHSACGFQNFTISPGGTVNGEGDITVSGTTAVAGSTSTGAGMALRGSGTVLVQGPGTIFGGIGGLTVDGGQVLHVAGSGVLTWTGGTINLDSTSFVGFGTLRNDGVLIISGNTGNITGNAGGAVLENSGILRKTASTAGHLASVAAQCSNTGTIEVETGTLRITTPFTNAGILRVHAGATLSDTSATFASSGTIEGNGTWATKDAATFLVNSGLLDPRVPGGAAAASLAIAGPLRMAAGSSIACDITSWSLPVPGTDHDRVSANSLDVTATPGAPVTLVVRGSPAGFAESALEIPLVQTSGGVTNFDAAKFLIDDSGFAGSGTWSVQVDGTALELVYVPGSGTDYEIWAASFGLDPLTDGAPGFDADHDGVSNECEYAFGLDPTDGASVSAVSGPLLPATATFTYTRRNPALSGLGYAIQVTTTLLGAGPGSWAVDAGAAQVVIGTTGDVQIVQVTLGGAPLGVPVLFARVVAE